MKCAQRFNIFGVEVAHLEGLCEYFSLEEIEKHFKVFSDAKYRYHWAVCTCHVCVDAFEAWVHRTLAEAATQ